MHENDINDDLLPTNRRQAKEFYSLLFLFNQYYSFICAHNRIFQTFPLQKNKISLSGWLTYRDFYVYLWRTLRILNEDNDITIFSLIGRKDLMAETF